MEQLRDVLHRPVRSDPVEPLVGRRRRQRTQRLDPSAQFDVVECRGLETLRQLLPARIPCRAQLRAGFPYGPCQPGDLVRPGVAAHECDAGHRTSVTGQQPQQFRLVEHAPFVRLQVRAVASRAAVGTARDVERQGRFAGNLGEHHVEIVIPHHPTPPWRNSAARPPAGEPPRSSKRASCSRSRASGSPRRPSGMRGTPSGSVCRCARTCCTPCWGC